MHLIIPIGFSSGILFSSHRKHVKHVPDFVNVHLRTDMEDVLAQAVTRTKEHSSA